MTDTIETIEKQKEVVKEPEKLATVEKPQVQPFKSFATQEDFDNETAKIRGNAERKTRSEILKQLGIDSEDKLEVIKKAYQDSLTEQDRITEQLKQLDVLKAELAENKAIVTALSKTSNRPAEEITKLVKMAKGLVSDDFTIEQALDEVISLVSKQPEKTQIPSSQVIPKQPETKEFKDNPFKNPDNIDGIMKAIKENPEQARKMAQAVGYKPINW